jgi:hypothetical protein
MATPEATAFVSYRGETCAVPLSATLTEALRLVEEAQPGLELADVTAKLLGPKYLKGSLSPALNPHVTLMAAGGPLEGKPSSTVQMGWGLRIHLNAVSSWDCQTV